MPKKRIRVLIVEDHNPTACLIKQAFGEKCANVEWDHCFAKDGEEALDCLFKRGEHAEAALPDFILLDWNLPKVSGRDVLRMLKGSDELRAIPVLIFSASQAEDDVRAAYNAHANGFISKPIDLDSLYAIIESIEMFWVHTVRLPAKEVA